MTDSVADGPRAWTREGSFARRGSATEAKLSVVIFAERSLEMGRRQQ